MPYIKQERRKQLEGGAEMLGKMCKNGGELNFVLTVIAKSFLYKKDNPKYEDRAMVVGNLECMIHEFKRRVLDSYEDQKRRENGDVY